ncbi:phage head closure protein [Acinetobacter tianfuensis]|uniref:Head-tail adaptor protein n=1 Tax=Acinetobacter tianfuensis TaxID=2419603 RepID=A0A3A8EL56_9GAMM|nr:phage head closure protein [Acinetobacter tianfuensis]RKG31490.1 head-tail adaptor protein [Acinetobacter tianfuensis]
MTQNAGELRHRIMVQHFTSGRDEDGYPIPEQWTDYVQLWAKVTHLSGKDLIAAQASQSKVIARLKIRYREDIDTTMRVIYKGKTYAIDSQALEDTNTGYESVTFLLSTM